MSLQNGTSCRDTAFADVPCQLVAINNSAFDISKSSKEQSRNIDRGGVHLGVGGWELPDLSLLPPINGLSSVGTPFSSHWAVWAPRTPRSA